HFRKTLPAAASQYQVRAKWQFGLPSEPHDSPWWSRDSCLLVAVGRQECLPHERFRRLAKFALTAREHYDGKSLALPGRPPWNEEWNNEDRASNDCQADRRRH